MLVAADLISSEDRRAECRLANGSGLTTAARDLGGPSGVSLSSSVVALPASPSPLTVPNQSSPPPGVCTSSLCESSLSKLRMGMPALATFSSTSMRFKDWSGRKKPVRGNELLLEFKDSLSGTPRGAWKKRANGRQHKSKLNVAHAHSEFGTWCSKRRVRGAVGVVVVVLLGCVLGNLGEIEFLCVCNEVTGISEGGIDFASIRYALL